ncbi:WecB/TagA/CpsF family glycosyltransferase [Gammaproteobacteria bacterium]|nr:WecB/TagA/CpsF family glycosyltransferase [Gammaproteobacteria bacterium]
MSYNIYSDTLDKLLINSVDKIIINTINPHSYVSAEYDDFYKTALNQSNFLLPDGAGIVLAARLLNQKKLIRISGSDFHEYTLATLNSLHGSVFYMGSSNETLKKIQSRLLSSYPNITIDFYSPPYKSNFTKEESDLIIDKINSFNPDVLFVGMTAPKQEKWLHEHKSNLNFKFASCIGAVFDFYAGTVTRPSKFWIDLHLEWFIRFIREPRRLFKRNFISAPLFLIDLLLYKLNLKKD